jgi:hypothetical protein
MGEMGKPQRRGAVVKFCLTTIATSVIVFAPVWLRYGAGFLTFYENHARPDWVTVVLRASGEVWSGLGLLGLGLALVGASMRLWRKSAPRASLPPPGNVLLLPALGLTIVIYGAAYLRLPDQAGYLIPIIPATLLLAARFAPRPGFQLFFLCLTIAPWLELRPGGCQAGAIITDHRERAANLRNVASCLAFAETLPGENVIVVGGWEPEIAVLAPGRPTLRNHYVYLLDAKEAATVLRSGRRIFYLPAIRSFNARVNGTDLARLGFDLFAVYQAKSARSGIR